MLIYGAWKAWAEVNGNRGWATLRRPSGATCAAVVPGMRAGRPREGEDRVRVYRGIGLRDSATGSQ